MLRVFSVFLICWMALAAFPAGLLAQEVMTQPGLRLLYPAGLTREAARYQRSWPQAVAAVARALSPEPPGTITVEVAANSENLTQRVHAITGESLPNWVLGVAIPSRDLVLVRADLPGLEDHRFQGLLTHELAHIVLHQRLSHEGATPAPRWLDEGLAQVAEGRIYAPQTVDLPVRAFFGRLIPLAELHHAFPRTEGASSLAYAQAESVTRFLRRVGGPTLIEDLILALESGLTLDAALLERTAKSLATWEKEWRKDLEKDRTWVPGILGQALIFLGILAAAGMGILRVRERRRRAEAEWADAPTDDPTTDLHHGLPETPGGPKGGDP